MKNKKIFSYFITTLTVLIWANQFAFAKLDESLEACTIGVAAGKATSDGHPIIWKTRDNSSAPNNEVFYNDDSSNEYKFISVITAGKTYAWMGVNECGFAILNSNSSDLMKSGDSGISHGSLMKHALGNFGTVIEFEEYLVNTNNSGRYTHANFAVMDSTGAAAIFETAGDEYWKFDANDSTVAPNGYVLRTNFAFNGDAKNGIHDGIYSIERYRRQVQLIRDFSDGDSLNYRSILRYQMRDFSDYDSNPVSVPFPSQWIQSRPYGYIFCYVSICRSTSVSTAVIQGVLPGEKAKLSTMWTILGQPASAIAVPYWPVGNTPPAANGSSTAPLCDIANQIKSLLFDYAENTNYIDSYKLRDENGHGMWSHTFLAEDSIFTAAEEKLDLWRTNTPTPAEMLATETQLADYALSNLQTVYDKYITLVSPVVVTTVPTNFMLEQNYPNPFNAQTIFNYYVPVTGTINLKIYNSIGQEVAILVNEQKVAGRYRVLFNTSDLVSGLYFYQLKSSTFTDTKKFILIK